jgi:formiminotetrahydrofolate cyclodeaminase
MNYQEQGTTNSVWTLTLKQFADKTDKAKPEITGGCVLFASSGLAIALVLMSLKISQAKTSNIQLKQSFDEKINELEDLRAQLARAADYDLEVFNSYRSLLKNNEPDEKELKLALKDATGSPLAICKLIRISISTASDCLLHCDKKVISDLKAGILLLQACFNGSLLLVEENLELLAPEDREFYQQWKEEEKNAL